MRKISKTTRCCVLSQNTVSRLVAVVILCIVTQYAVAANKGNVSAAVNTLVIGAILAFLISLVFALQKNQDRKIMGIKLGKFFLLFSILLLIVFVTGAAAFFIFM